MALINNAPPPLGDPIAQQTRKEFKAGEDPQAGLCSQPWGDWFTALLAVLEKAPGRVFSVGITAQSGDIGDTDIGDSVSAGTYRVSYYLRMSTLDSISAVIDITFTWTWNGATRTLQPIGLGSNVLTETASYVFLLKADSNSVIQYKTTTSFGSGDGRYALDIVLEEISA